MKAMGIGQEEKGTYVPVKPGVYRAIVSNCQYYTGGDTKRGLDVVFRIAEEGEYKNRTMKYTVFVNYDPTKGGFTFKEGSPAHNMFTKFGEIIGKPSNMVDCDADLIAEKNVKCYIKIEEVWSEKQKKSFSNVTAIYDPKTYKRDGVVASAPVAAVPVAPAPVAPAPVAPVSPAAKNNDTW